MSAEETRINQMVEDIIENANNEAKKILGEAKKQIKEILEKGNLVAEEKKNEIVENESKMISELEKQQIASINLQTRREILQKKEEEIKKAFDKAKDELKDFPKKAAYKKTLEMLIKEAGIAIGGGKILVKAKKEDQSKLKDLSKVATEITKETGKKTTLKLAKEKINAMGGVIVLLDDASITIDNTFEARLEQKYRTIRNQVAKTLFG